jgi:hypothetical protein
VKIALAKDDRERGEKRQLAQSQSKNCRDARAFGLRLRSETDSPLSHPVAPSKTKRIAIYWVSLNSCPHSDSHPTQKTAFPSPLEGIEIHPSLQPVAKDDLPPLFHADRGAFGRSIRAPRPPTEFQLTITSSPNAQPTSTHQNETLGHHFYHSTRVPSSFRLCWRIKYLR